MTAPAERGRGAGERSRGGSGRPAVSGGCRTQFQLGKKKKKLNCPAPSNRCVSRRKLGSRSRSFSPLSCPPRVPAWVPAVGPGKVKARRVQPAAAALVARGEEPGLLHSASPPPLGAHRRLLLRPGGAPLRRRRSWRLGPGGASDARFRWGQPRSQPAGGTGFSRRSRRALRVRADFGRRRWGAGPPEGAKSTPTPADFRLQRGGWRGAARVPSRLETPPAAIGARPPCAPSERGASSSPRASCWGALVYASPGGFA